MKSTTGVVTATAILGVASASSASITISVPDVNFGKQNLNTPFPGASTAFSTSFLNYVVGTAGNNRYKRPIIPFLRSSFDSVAGLPLTSATLHFAITNNHTELGESFESEVRLFTTAETELSNDNAQVFAGLTGDGGDHAVVGTYLLSDDLAGFQSLEFSPVALGALFEPG